MVILFSFKFEIKNLYNNKKKNIRHVWGKNNIKIKKIKSEIAYNIVKTKIQYFHLSLNCKRKSSHNT